MKDEIRMAVPLPSELEKELFDRRDEAIELVDRDLFDEAFEMMGSAWHKVPEPKFNTSCSARILISLAEIWNLSGRHQELEPILTAWANDVETCGYKIVQPAPFILLGEAYLYLGEFDKSKEQLYKAMKYGATERDFIWTNPLCYDIARKKITINKVIQNLFKEIEDAYPLLPEAIKGQVNDAAEAGMDFMEDEQFDEAIEVWKKGLALIPEPRHSFAKSMWFEASIGNAYFMQDDFENALTYFEKTKRNIPGNPYDNPFIMMRIGQSHFEMEDFERAKEYLLRAYLFQYGEIFDKYENPKYLMFLSSVVDLNRFEEE